MKDPRIKYLIFKRNGQTCLKVNGGVIKVDDKSKKFWDKRTVEVSLKGRWVRVFDDQPVRIEIDDWTILRPDTKYGKQEAIKTVDGKFFSVSSVYVTDLLADLVGRHVVFDFIRHDSKPDSSQTWGELDNVTFLDDSEESENQAK